MATVYFLYEVMHVEYVIAKQGADRRLEKIA